MGNLLEKAGEMEAESRDADILVTDAQGHETWDLPNAQNADVGFRGRRLPAGNNLLRFWTECKHCGCCSGFSCCFSGPCKAFADAMRLFCPSAVLRSVHIHDATIEYSNKPAAIVAHQNCSTIRLSKIRFIVNSGIEKHLDSPGQTQGTYHLLVASGHKSTLSMEDCVLEATFDSPSLFGLVVCAAMEGGQVSEILGPAARDVYTVCPLFEPSMANVLCSGGICTYPFDMHALSSWL
jgi:hypothetical protein